MWSEMFLSQGKRPVARKPLAAISPVAAHLYALPNCSLDGDDSPVLGLDGVIFQFLGSRMF